MNIFRALSFLMAILVSSAAFANEPQLILFNSPKKVLIKTEKEEDLQKFEINNDEIINIYSLEN